MKDFDDVLYGIGCAFVIVGFISLTGYALTSIIPKNNSIYYVRDANECTWKGELSHFENHGVIVLKYPELISGDCEPTGAPEVTIAFSSHWKEE